MKFDEDGQAQASFECAVMEGNKLYFAEELGNEIFYYDMELNRVTWICSIHEEDERGRRLFSCMIIYEEDIFLFPFLAKGIYRVAIKTGQYDRIDLPKEFVNGETNEPKFIDAHLYKGVIYVMPAAFRGILQLQCNTNKMSVYDSWIKKIPLGFLDVDKAFFRKTLFADEKVYAPSCQGNIVLIFDLEKWTCSVKKVGTNLCRFSGICYDEGNYWISPRDKGPIVRWNEKDDTWQEYKDFPQNYIAGSTIGIEVLKNQIFVIPQMANMILVIDCADGTVKEWNKLYRKRVLWYKKWKGSLILCLEEAEVLILKADDVKSIKIVYPEIMQKQYRRRMSATYRILKKGIEKEDVLKETYFEALKDYCDYVLHNEMKKKNIIQKDNRATDT